MVRGCVFFDDHLQQDATRTANKALWMRRPLMVARIWPGLRISRLTSLRLMARRRISKECGR